MLDAYSRMNPPPLYRRQYQHQQQIFEVLIKRSRRKTLAIHVLRTGLVEIRAPLQCAWLQIDDFLEARLDWIVAAIQQLANSPLPEAPAYCDGECHDYLGQPHQLLLVRGKPSQVVVGAGQLLVQCAAPSDPQQVRQCLLKFWRQRALLVLDERLRDCRAHFDQVPAVAALIQRKVALSGEGANAAGKLTIRRMRARWGSCSRGGDICLNAALVQKPTVAIDMVIIHELCHLHHFSHSKAFYGLMDAAMPGWRDHEGLLNQPSWRRQTVLV
jgi:predicted metal-dependent hydrolase